MRAIDVIKESAQRADKDLDQQLKNGQVLREYGLVVLNDYLKDLNNKYPWPWRFKEYTIQTVLNHKDGTVTVTKASRSVSGGSGFTSVLVGRYLKLDRDDDIYKVIAVPTSTTLTLETPYLKDTANTQSYIIWKRFYDLAPEVPEPTSVRLNRWPYDLKFRPKQTFEQAFVRPYYQGIPVAWTMYGENPETVTYNTGTVTIADKSVDLVGSGTEWLDNVNPGAEIIIASKTYNVDLVNSDTSITLLQKVTPSVSAVSYALTMKNRARIVVSGVPDPAINMRVQAFRRTYSLVNEEDVLPIWDSAGRILSDVLYGIFLEKSTDSKSFNWLGIYETGVIRLWNEIQQNDPNPSAIPSHHAMPVGYRPGLYG